LRVNWHISIAMQNQSSAAATKAGGVHLLPSGEAGLLLPVML
jgi:hypothetical protein